MHHTECLLGISEVVNGLNNAIEAPYDYAGNKRKKMESCLEGTRVKVLGEIKDWVERTDRNHARIFWLSGMAGLGKSAISRSIAEWAKGKNILGATFFFSRDVPNLRDSTLVFPTLAHQLAQFDMGFRRKLAAILSQNPDVASHDFNTQFEQLIKQPWAASHESSKVLIVLDAIDECDIESEVRELLRTLLTKSRSMPVKLLVFLASRRERYIELELKGDDIQGLSQNMEDFVVEDDIEKFLRFRLSHIAEDLKDFVPAKGWPEDQDIKTIVEQSGKLFVYAATAHRFIVHGVIRDPETQLKWLVSRRNGTSHEISDNPYSNLDQLYLRVLQDATKEFEDKDHWFVRRIREVIATIVLLRNPLPMKIFADFLQLQEPVIRTALYRLHSIIVVPPTGTDSEPNSESSLPRYFHPSFPDFITNSQRCSDPRFQVDTQREESRILSRCFDLMNTLKRNMLDDDGREETSQLQEKNSNKFNSVFRALVAICMSILGRTPGTD